MIIKYGLTETVTVIEQRGYTTTYDYALEEERDSTNRVSWIDMESQHDNVRCSFKALVLKADLPKLENLVRVRNKSNPIEISALLDGFKPFGWNKDHSGTVEITILSIKPERQKNIFAKVQRYEFIIAPVTALSSGTIAADSCRDFGFTMEGAE